MSKITVLSLVSVLNVVLENSRVDLQKSHNKDTRKTDFLSTGNRQTPDYLHRHNGNDSIGDDIWDLESVVELGEVHAATGQIWVPQLLGRDAIKAACENTTNGPENDNAAYNLHRDMHRFGGEEAAVECQDRELDACNAARVEDRAGE